MKICKILIFILLVSCSQKTKSTQDANEKVLDTIEQQSAGIEKNASAPPPSHVSFLSLINDMPKKELPFIDATNFDSFIDEFKIYNKEEIALLQLEKLYPNFYKERYNYRATPSYRLNYSNAFNTIVIAVFKGENEMESVLINYNVDGNIIDSKVIAYDEIAESIAKIESKIEQDKITINEIIDLEEKSQTLSKFMIDPKGKIMPLDSDQNENATEEIDLVKEVIFQLNLNPLHIYESFITVKVQPNNPNETIVIIPEIEGEYSEDDFSLNSYIVLVNSTTGEVTHTYFESAKTNGWDSSAEILGEISIDTARYILTENTRAFGITVYHYGMSKPNPYSNKTISLFVKSGDSLKRVLRHYDIEDYGGEWDMICTGEFSDIKNTLILSEEKTNDYFDIIVKSKITNTKSFAGKNEECEEENTVTSKTMVLKFNGETYKEQNK